MTVKNKIYIHAVFWIIMVVSTILEVIPSIGKYTSGILAGDYLIYLISHISVFYIFYFFSNSYRNFIRNKILLIVSGAFLVLLVNLLFTYLYAYFISADILELKNKDFYVAFSKVYFSILQPLIFYAIAGALLRLVIMWFESELTKKESEKKQITGELKLLRSQINPDFLYSSFNYIKNKVISHPKEAISNIEDLSEIMSYMLYETSSEKVLLDDEINYIRNYISLQSSGFEPGFINFEVNGVTSGIFVPPLLFMPLLEYIFSRTKNYSVIPGIIIKLSIANWVLTFNIRSTAHNNSPINTESLFTYEKIKNLLKTQLEDTFSLEKKDAFGISEFQLTLKI